MRQTKTIPIVFLATDPVRAGLVTNLAWPAGNLTGFTLDPGREYYSKLLQFLVDAVSSANRVGYVSPRRLWEPAERIVRSAAATLGVTLVPVTRDEPVDEEAVRRVFAALADNRVDAYVRGPGQTGALLQLFADLTMERRLPAIGPIPQLAHLGALMSYEANRPSVFGGVGGYVAKILDGAYPGDLPAQQPTVFDFVINLKTAAALGLTIPPKLMIFATEFIE